MFPPERRADWDQARPASAKNTAGGWSKRRGCRLALDLNWFATPSGTPIPRETSVRPILSVISNAILE